jgi:predicted transcriptional regulator
MSTVAEIREAISKLSPEDQSRLMAELFESIPLPQETDPAFLAALDRGIADDEADRVYSIEQVDTKVQEWISKSSSPKAR